MKKQHNDLEKLLRWEKEGVMKQTIEANRTIIEWYKNTKLTKKERNLIAVNKYRKTKKGKLNREKQAKKYLAKAKEGRYKEVKAKYQKTKKFKDIKRKYLDSKKGKKEIARNNARRRKLGFHIISFPLNVPYDWHHVNKNDVVAIQKYIHKAIPHKCGDGKLESVLG